MRDNRKLSIKEWSPEDRPSDKLLEKGIFTLSDAELLAIIIRSGTREDSAVELAKRILAAVNNNLNSLGKLSIDDLLQYKGIGHAKAISIVAALELGRRRKHSETIHRNKITSGRDVYEHFHAILGDLPHEEFWILLLDRSNKIIHQHKLSQGGIHGTVADIRIILHLALEKLASSIILCHNHPSGQLLPSEADKSLTQKIRESATLMDISLLDHIILTDGNYYSFAEKGIL